MPALLAPLCPPQQLGSNGALHSQDKVTGMSAGYGFIKFLDHRAADLALQSINGRVLYGQVSVNPL